MTTADKEKDTDFLRSLARVFNNNRNAVRLVKIADRLERSIGTEPGTKMDQAFEDVIEHAVDYIYDEELDRDDARHYLNGYLEEKLREFAAQWGRKVERGFLEWLLGVD